MLLLPLLLSCGTPSPDGLDTSATDPPSPTLWYPDADGDGWGDASNAQSALVAPPAFIAVGGDCDDQDPRIHPGADEHCDYWDEDCDGVIDEDAVDAPTWYVDGDGDGYGPDSSAVTACQAPADTIQQGADCDDSRDDVHPGAPEADCTDPTDYNCDGSVGYADSDGDGWPACLECDDTVASSNPTASETCNGSDDDCDGAVDEADAVDAPTWYNDADGDGYGDDDATTVACEAPSGAVAVGGDCRDDSSEAWPGGTEVPCDGLDNDCAGDGDVRCVPEGEHDLGYAETIFYGEAEGDILGNQVDVGGDIDGDGKIDLAIAASQQYSSGADYRRGAVYLIDGSTYGGSAVTALGSTVEGDASEDGVGDRDGAVVILKDLNGDGFDDLSIGLPNTKDELLLFLGPVTADRLTSDADLSVFGSTLAQGIGKATASADLDNDGVVDLIYSTTGSVYTSGEGWADDSGRVWGFLGPITGDVETDDADFTVGYQRTNANFGSTICANDVDGDGINDLTIGAVCASGCPTFADYGAVYIMAGPIEGALESVDSGSGLTDAAARWQGSENASYAGYSTSCRGDVDGDGRSDVVVGAPDSKGDGYGAAYIVDGQVSGDNSLGDAVWAVSAGDAEEWVGIGVTADSDLDGDGVSDVALTTLGDGTYTGAALLFYGGGLVGTASPTDADASWSAHNVGDAPAYLAGGDDVDGDGYDDLLLGAIGEDTNGDWAGAAYLIYGGGWVP